MVATTRMTREERRTAIVRAVREVFADKGFDGTTTRELADAAGVSEALLFKHFPTKEALYHAMKEACCSDRDRDRFARLKNLDDSASTLVLMVHFLVSLIICKRRDSSKDQAVQNRLFLRSLCEDGDFARMALEPLGKEWVRKIERCHKAAVKSGDALADTTPLGLRGWFTHHVAAMIAFAMVPSEPAVAYGVSAEQVVEQTVWFCLRGIGLKDETIRRHYNPNALALLHD
jgi:AcrR family transcriptional regulator